MALSLMVGLSLSIVEITRSSRSRASGLLHRHRKSYAAHTPRVGDPRVATSHLAARADALVGEPEGGCKKRDERGVEHDDGERAALAIGSVGGGHGAVSGIRLRLNGNVASVMVDGPLTDSTPSGGVDNPFCIKVGRDPQHRLLGCLVALIREGAHLL
jgi:hypothetical protein